MKMAIDKKGLIIFLVVGLMLGAGSASAQVLVGYQQRFFEKFSDGSGTGGLDIVPCCAVTQLTIMVPNTPMGITLMRANPVATVEPRTIADFYPLTSMVNQRTRTGAYQAEFKIKTVFPANFGFMGTPGVYNGKGPRWYGVYQPATGGVTLKQGRFKTVGSLMLVFPGGNLRRLTTMLNRTVMDLVIRPNQGPGNFVYSGMGHVPPKPAFRANTPNCTGMELNPFLCWRPYLRVAGQLRYTQKPVTGTRFGGTRAIIHDQRTNGVDNGDVPGFANRFVFPVANGFGQPFPTPMGNAIEPHVRRETRSATFARVEITSTMMTSGMAVFSGLGTGWFTIAPFTTGTVEVIASTVGTFVDDFSRRTEMGFKNLNVTGMGGITGTLQLVSGHLLQSKGGIDTNLAGTNRTIITFTPEPTSAALLGAGALGLIGLIVRDRRSNRV